MHPSSIISASEGKLPRAVFPEDPGYDDARAAWNLHADQRPAAVVTAASAEDVVGAVELANTLGLRVAPQSTGHLATALPSLADTILVKTAIGGVTVDPAARRARVGAGAIWQDVVDAVTPHGLAALSGSSHDVGVVGYTLGGGMSWLARQYGLAANHVHAVELVTADGRLVRADARQNAELFWAVRGGGGNFGVVTAIEFELFPITEVFAGMTIWSIDQARAVLAAWASFAASAPDPVTTSLRILRLPPLPEVPEPLRDTPVVVVDGAVLAAPHVAGAMLEEFRTVGAPLIDTWAPVSPADLLQLHMDPPMPVPALGDTMNTVELDARGIDAFLAAIRPDEVAPLLMAELRQLGGALGRRPDGAGARATLTGQFALFAVGMPQSPEHAAAINARLDELTAAMQPWSAGSFYLNFADRGGIADGAFDRRTLAHLRAVRRTWDPERRFVASHEIRLED